MLHLLVSVASTTAYGCQVGPGDGLGMQPTASVGKNLGWGGVGWGVKASWEHQGVMSTFPMEVSLGRVSPIPIPCSTLAAALGRSPEGQKAFASFDTIQAQWTLGPWPGQEPCTQGTTGLEATGSLWSVRSPTRTATWPVRPMARDF